MFAALTSDRKYLMLSVVNATETEQRFNLNVTGTRLSGPSTLWQMTGKSLDAANHARQPPQVEVKEIQMGTLPESIPVAPISVNIYRFAVAH